MKNAIYIDVDTDREQPITFSKPQEAVRPTNKEEAAAMVLNDIACVSEALAVLILTAHHNDLGNKEVLVKASVATISSVLTDPANEP